MTQITREITDPCIALLVSRRRRNSAGTAPRPPRLAVEEAAEDDFQGAPVKSLGDVQVAGVGQAAVAVVLVHHLNDQPAALRSGGASLVAKGQRVVFYQVAPHI